MLKKLLIISFLMLAAVADSAAQSARTLAKNKAIVSRVFEEILSKGKINENDHLYAADFVAHGDTRDATRAEDREAARGWRSAVPDLTMRIAQIVAEKDLVTVRWVGQGTNTGTGNGLPATGKKFKVSGITLFRVVKGKIQEEWTYFNEAGLFKQLGLAPEEIK